MKPCNYISESIVLVTPTAGTSYKAKLVTEYGRDATGGLIVVSTRYVDANNAVISLAVTDAVEVVAAGQPVEAQSGCIISTEQEVCSDGTTLRMVTEYGFDATGGLIVVSTRYVNAKNEVVVAAAPTFGGCAKPTFPEGIVCYDVGGVTYSAQTLNGVTTWTDTDGNPVAEPDLTTAELTCCPECVDPCLDYYSELHNLVVGDNVIPHGLGLTNPHAFLIELWSEIDGDFVHPQITAVTADNLTLTSTVEAQGIRVTIKAAEGCRGLEVEGGPVAVLQDGVQATDSVNSLNFTGATVTDDGSGNVTVAIDAPPALIVDQAGVQVEDATTSLNFTGNVTATSDGAGNVTVNVPPTPEYASVVYIDTATPSTATSWSLYPEQRFDSNGNPIDDNNPALAQDPQAIYIGSDGSTWTWNGTAYVTTPVPSTTEWYLANTTVDAGSNKTGAIYRTGDVLLSTNGSPMQSPVRMLHLQDGGTTGVQLSTTRGGALVSSNRVWTALTLENLNPTDPLRRVSAIINDGNATWLGTLNPNGQSARFAYSFCVDHATGWIGMGTSTPASRFANTGIAITGSAGMGVAPGFGISWIASTIAYTAGFYNSVNGGHGFTIKVNGTGQDQILLDLVSNSPAGNSVGDKVMRAYGNSRTYFGGPNASRPTSTLDTAGSFSANIVRVSGAYTPLETDHSIIFTGNGSLTLPAATQQALPTLGNVRRIYNIRAWAGTTVTVTGHIEGVSGATRTLTGPATLRVHSDGATWNEI